MLDDADWELIRRTDGTVAKTVKARDLWEEIGHAAWASADPGMQYHDTINDWHTCPASGQIRASNPCSEYMFLDDTACNLASMNLLTFLKDGVFDTAAYEHATRLWTVTLEVSVTMAQFPSKEIAERSYRYRTLGLGYANIGGLLMTLGHSYDSDEGRAICGALSAIMTGVSYKTSAEMAGELGPFPGYEPNAAHMLRVMRNHRRAAYSEIGGYEELATKPVPLDAGNCPDTNLVDRARVAWDEALALGEQHGYRNAQSSVIAPTGTIGLVMDCDTTGIEPDFALVKFKKLAGGGYFKIINRGVPKALENLGYTEEQIAEIEAYAVGRGTLEGAPGVTVARLKQLGFGPDEFEKIEAALGSAFDIRFVFNQWTLGVDFCTETLHLPQEQMMAEGFDLLRRRGVHRGRNRCGQHPCLRDHDAGRCTASEGRAPAGLRLRQPLRQAGQALPVGEQPYRHDGGGTALHLGRDLEDDQHAQRGHHRGLQGSLPQVVAYGREGQCPVPRRLQAVAAPVRQSYRRLRGG